MTWIRDLLHPGHGGDLGPQFTRLTSGGELDAVLAAPSVSVLYLHDPFCPISAMAHRQMQQLTEAVAYIDVAADHPLGMEVERRTGIRHESPQAFVLANGAVAWSASHRAITARAVTTAIAAARAASPPAPETGVS